MPRGGWGEEVEALQDQVVEVMNFFDHDQQGQEHPLKDHQLYTIRNKDKNINRLYNNMLYLCLVEALEVP